MHHIKQLKSNPKKNPQSKTGATDKELDSKHNDTLKKIVFEYPAPVSGQISSISKHDGDYVEKGQTVLDITQADGTVRYINDISGTIQSIEVSISDEVVENSTVLFTFE